MNRELISIIVPVYNVKKYLSKCIESIINQTYKNLEIILIDDGSTDNSGKICDEYKEKDNRIIVIHKENGGLSEARNYGLDIATGDYICFVDSDDFIELNYIENLLKLVEDNDVKLAQCGFTEFYENKDMNRTISYPQNCIQTGKEMLGFSQENAWQNIVVWNKMYHKDLFKKIRFPKGKIHEDEFTTYKILYELDKVAIIKDCLYNYRRNENSITGKEFNLKRLDAVDALEERIEFFSQRNETRLKELTLKSYLNLIIIDYKKIADSNAKKNLKKKYNLFFMQGLKVSNIKLKTKVKYIFFYFFPNLYGRIKR